MGRCYQDEIRVDVLVELVAPSPPCLFAMLTSWNMWCHHPSAHTEHALTWFLRQPNHSSFLLPACSANVLGLTKKTRESQKKVAFGLYLTSRLWWTTKSWVFLFITCLCDSQQPNFLRMRLSLCFKGSDCEKLLLQLQKLKFGLFCYLVLEMRINSWKNPKQEKL